jgi:hypothetical protein
MRVPDGVDNDWAAIVRFFQPKFLAFQHVPPDFTFNACLFSPHAHLTKRCEAFDF